MAIEIIPKEAAKLPLWQNILFYVSIAVLLAVILCYGILYKLGEKASITLKERENLYEQNKTPEILSLESEILDYKNKISAFSNLISQHKFSSTFFQFLEKITHPKVVFLEMDFNVKDNKITLFGQTDSFLTLGQQIMIFKQQNMIKNVQLSNIGISKEGKVEFNIDITLDAKLFIPKELEQACTDSGGTISTASCCKSVTDFPNTCLIGSCGCSADDSYEVKSCGCGPEKCFNGYECVSP
jgi:hypothetical protein